MTIDERLAKMWQTLQLQASLAAEEQKRHEARLPKLEQEHAKTERTLRRAIESCAREKRNERKRRQPLEARSKSSPTVGETASIDSSPGALSYGKRGRTMTIEERLEAMAQTLELKISLQADEKKRTDLQIALHEQRMAKLDQEHDKTERALRRAIDYSAREMRNERKRRQESDDRLDRRLQELAESADRRHAELEAALKKFLERSGNGQH